MRCATAGEHARHVADGWGQRVGLRPAGVGPTCRTGPHAATTAVAKSLPPSLLTHVHSIYTQPQEGTTPPRLHGAAGNDDRGLHEGRVVRTAPDVGCLHTRKENVKRTKHSAARHRKARKRASPQGCQAPQNAWENCEVNESHGSRAVGCFTIPPPCLQPTNHTHNAPPAPATSRRPARSTCGRSGRAHSPRRVGAPLSSRAGGGRAERAGGRAGGQARGFERGRMPLGLQNFTPSAPPQRHNAPPTPRKRQQNTRLLQHLIVPFSRTTRAAALPNGFRAIEMHIPPPLQRRVPHVRLLSHFLESQTDH
jgi:hypothetical protein